MPPLASTASHTLRIEQAFTVEYRYTVSFTHGAFTPENPLLRDVFDGACGEPARVLAVLDEGLVAARPGLPQQIEDYFRLHSDCLHLVCEPWIVRGGEALKNDPREVEACHRLIYEHGLCRHSYVLAAGGGAVLDAIGYAVATAHRGLRLVRMPSTVLGQNDAGVGVKNAINWQGRKNFLGTFVPPCAVINDLDFIASGNPADRRAGIAEAVKVALIRDSEFFGELYRGRFALARLETDAMEAMIVRCAALHLAQIRNSGDPFERGSARPLDFGHWSAHRLEEMTDGRLRHGEAVAIGIALDSLYSHRTGLFDQASLFMILEILSDIGFAIYDPVLEKLDIAAALDAFREHLGGKLCITELAAIGRGVELGVIDAGEMLRCVGILRRWHESGRRGLQELDFKERAA